MNDFGHIAAESPERNSANIGIYLSGWQNNSQFGGSAKNCDLRTIPRSVSRCGTYGPSLLARSHCYVAHFNCEQELNSICSHSFRDQHTRWYRDALLSNPGLTFTPPESSSHSPPSPESGVSPQFHCGERSIRAAMTAIHIEVSIPCQLHPGTSTSPSVTQQGGPGLRDPPGLWRPSRVRTRRLHRGLPCPRICSPGLQPRLLRPAPRRFARPRHRAHARDCPGFRQPGSVPHPATTLPEASCCTWGSTRKPQLRPAPRSQSLPRKSAPTPSRSSQAPKATLPSPSRRPAAGFRARRRPFDVRRPDRRRPPARRDRPPAAAAGPAALRRADRSRPP